MDPSVPVLLVKVGHYPLHHGAVGAVRTLGRLGVAVHVIAEGRFTSAAVSRHRAGRIVWPTTGAEPAAELVRGLGKIAASLPRPAVAVATDDEAAILLAEHAEELSEHLLLPPVPRDLPRLLASKHEMFRLCRRYGIPAPESRLVTSRDQIDEIVRDFTFPVVVKNSEPWVRLAAPVVSRSTVVGTPGELRDLAAGWPASPYALVQEYLPRAESTDWIAHVCCDARSDTVVGFTGVKVRSWPPHVGVTTYAYSVGNPELATLTARFCKESGYAGVADLDWRLDHRDGRYKLLDFNPRVGAQFRLFETDAGIDVIRAHYLTSTGQEVPAGTQVEGRRIIVENLDVPARIAYRRSGERRHPIPPGGGREFAWLTADDPLPGLVTAARSARPMVRRVAARLFGGRPQAG
ncbi:ATP-grasp domain-containing protein [Streptosporangium violaceochromogenes]|nr:ATP-grasp domain-containing protein [Streptosporangium violaceochromogenes]